MPTRGNYYRVYSYMGTLAGILAVVWTIYICWSYQRGIADVDYDENGVLDRYGVSLLIAEQGESISWFERQIAGVEEKRNIHREMILVLERAMAKSQLEETGLTTLACLQWAKGDKEACRAIIVDLPSEKYNSTQIIIDLLAGKTLNSEQWQGLEGDVNDRPRDWMVCFLAEKALEHQSYEGAGLLESIVQGRKLGLLRANAIISILMWLVFFAGVASVVILVRSRKISPNNSFAVAPRLVTLWPLSLAIIVFVIGDFLAVGLVELLWVISPENMGSVELWIRSVAYDTIWRLLGVVMMFWIFFKKTSYLRRTLLSPVPKLAHWVLAACAVTWLFDMVFYQLPSEWFSADPTIGYQWEDAGWSGLISGLVSSVVLAPICEEIIFRGLLYNAIKNRLGAHTGVWISSLIFASVHFYGIQDLIAVGFFGVVMAYLYRHTNSLLPCILCHALFNFIITGWSWVIYLSPETLWAR